MAKRVLVTNDDGIDALGLRVLTATLVEHGYEPLVVAPDRDYSGAAGSLLSLGTGDPVQDQGQVRYEQRVLDEAPGVEAYALDGPPALCALLAIREAFGPVPDLVASGINLGLNVGPAVMHSGTVNAALTAARAGVPSLAISAQFSPDHPDEMRYDTAAVVASQVLSTMADSGHSIVSLNVPRCDLNDLKGLASAPLATSFRWRSYVESIGDGLITRTYAETGEPAEPGTDSALIDDGWATLSSLVGIATVDCADLIESVAHRAGGGRSAGTR